MKEEINKLDMSYDQIVEAKFESEGELLAGKFKRRRRIPNIFDKGENIQKKYKNGKLDHIVFYNTTGIKEKLTDIAIKKSKSKQKFVKKKTQKGYMYIDGIRTKILRKTGNIVEYWFFFEPGQVKDFKENLAEVFEIHPICDEKVALKLSIQKNNKKKVKEFLLGFENSAQLKYKWKYKIQNILDKQLKVYIKIVHSNPKKD